MIFYDISVTSSDTYNKTIWKLRILLWFCYSSYMDLYNYNYPFYFYTLRFNFFLHMYISSNSIAVSKNKCVIDGPNTGNLNFGGTDVALQEGRSGTWSCSVYRTNPASTLIWQNDTHTFMPSSPAVVKKVSISVRSLLLSLIII